MAKINKKDVCPVCGTTNFQVIGRKNWFTLTLMLSTASVVLALMFSPYFYLGLVLGGVMFIVAPFAGNIALCKVCQKVWPRKYVD